MWIHVATPTEDKKLQHVNRRATQEEIDVLAKSIGLFQTMIMTTNSKREIIEQILSLAGFLMKPIEKTREADYRCHFENLKIGKQALARVLVLMVTDARVRKWESDYMWYDYTKSFGKNQLPSQQAYIAEIVDSSGNDEEPEDIKFPRLEHYPSASWLTDSDLFNQFHKSIKDLFDKYEIGEKCLNHRVTDEGEELFEVVTDKVDE